MAENAFRLATSGNVCSRLPLRVLNAAPSSTRGRIDAQSYKIWEEARARMDVQPYKLFEETVPVLALVEESTTLVDSLKHRVSSICSDPSKVYNKGRIFATKESLSSEAQLKIPQQRRRSKQPTVIMKSAKLMQEANSLRAVEPCGALGQLNPGIVGGVRDCRRIHSFIGAVAGSKRSREMDSVQQQSMVQNKLPKREDDSDVLSLEGILRTGSESGLWAIPKVKQETDAIQSDSSDYLSGQSSQSWAAAQWFELLSLDIKGRLAALKRSRRRVRTAIVAKEDVVYPKDNVLGISCSDDSEENEREKRQFGLQMDRWKTLFVSMDVALGVEASNLEKHWRKIQQMQATLVHKSGCTCNGVTT